MTTTETPAPPDASPDAEPSKIDSAASVDPPTAPVPTGADGAESEPHGVPERVRELARRAEEARLLRQLATNPDVVALGVEDVWTWVSRLAWTGIVGGLAFTMVNVQSFAAQGAEPWSPEWVAAWLLDPMVSLVLISMLLAEQVAARWLVQVGPWVRAMRWTALAATYGMNTWTAWFPPGGIAEAIPSRILLHSVPPLLVFFAVEAITDAREAMIRAVYVAASQAGVIASAGAGSAPTPEGPAPVPPSPAPIPTEAELRTMGRDKLREEARRIGGVATRGDVEPLRVRVLAARGFAPVPSGGTGADDDAAATSA